MNIGDKCTYIDNKGNKQTGEILGVKKVDTKSGPKIIGYVVSTGNVLYTDKITNDKNKKVNHKQLEAVEVSLSDLS